MKKFGLILLSIILVTGLVFFGCKNDPDEPGPEVPGPVDPSPGDEAACPDCGAIAFGETWDENIVFTGTDPITGEYVENLISAPSSVWQKWRECKDCGYQTYPELPGVLDADNPPPEGAVWLGIWEEDTALQSRWPVTNAALKARIQSGELNRLYLYFDKTKAVPQGTTLANPQFVVNADRTPDCPPASSASWRQRTAVSSIVGDQVSFYSSLNQAQFDALQLPMFTLIDHIPDHAYIDWDGSMFQFFIQQTASAGGMVNLWPVALFVGPGLPGDPGYVPPPPPTANLTVTITAHDGTSTTQATTINAVGGGVAEITDGYRFVKTANHRGGYAWFTVNFGAGKSLSDYKEVKFTYNGTTADTRRFALLARAQAFAGLSAHNLDASGAGYLCSLQVTQPVIEVVDGENTYPGVPNGESTLTLEIINSASELVHNGTAAVDAQADTALAKIGEVWLSLYEHTNASTFEITNIEFIEKDPEPYKIGLDVSGTHIFDQADIGYTDAPELEVTILNTGANATGALTIALSNDTDFEVDPASISDIAAGGSATFKVSPVTGLGVGNKTSTVTVSGGNGLTASFSVEFRVVDPNNLGFNLTIGDLKLTNLTLTQNHPTNVTTSLIGDEGYQFERTGAGHGSAFAWFEVNIGAKKLADMEFVEFTYEPIGDGGGSSRRPSLLAIPIGDDFASASLGGGNSSGPYYLSKVWANNTHYVDGILIENNGSGAAGSDGVQYVVRLMIDPAKAAILDASGSEFKMMIYDHIADNNGHKVTNIKFGEKVFKFADFYATHYGTVEGRYTSNYPADNENEARRGEGADNNRYFYDYIGNSASSHQPFAMNSGNGNNNRAKLVADGKMEYFLGGSGQGINVDLLNLGMDVATNLYEIIITGEVTDCTGSGVFRIHNNGLITVDITQTGPFVLKGIIPVAAGNQLRLGVDGPAVPMSLTIDNILITCVGPRE